MPCRVQILFNFINLKKNLIQSNQIKSRIWRTTKPAVKPQRFLRGCSEDLGSREIHKTTSVQNKQRSWKNYQMLSSKWAPRNPTNCGPDCHSTRLKTVIWRYCHLTRLLFGVAVFWRYCHSRDCYQTRLWFDDNVIWRDCQCLLPRGNVV